MVAKAVIDTLREKNFAAITAAYTTLGAPSAHLIRLICITNNTNGNLKFSDDGVTDKLFVAAGSFKLFDVQSNQNDKFDDKYCLPIGMQLSVKYITQPTEGDVYVEILY